MSIPVTSSGDGLDFEALLYRYGVDFMGIESEDPKKVIEEATECLKCLAVYRLGKEQEYGKA